mgnify:CR=1 FL=1|jgi:hypothetical protein
MIDLIKPNYKNMNISRNANSRNRRKMINGFKGEGTLSGWVKTSPYGTIEHKLTLEEREHARRVNNFRNVNFDSKHAGSKRTLNRY